MSSTNSAYSPTPISFASVPIQQIIENNRRLDASAYDMAVLKAKEQLRHSEYGYLTVSDLVEKAYVGNRFKRIYTNNPNDIPFFIPSDIENIYPKASKYISAKTNTSLEDLRVARNMLLMSCSGTIGKTTIVGKKLENQLFSHDLLRITFKEDYDLGYAYAYFNTDTGLTLLQGNNYGAVIDHIEPEHLNHVIIPDAPVEIRKRIHKLVMESFALRDESNELIDKAQELLYAELQLPRLSAITPKRYAQNVAFNNYTVKVSQLNGRIDASYHVPIAEEITKYIPVGGIKKKCSLIKFFNKKSCTIR